MIRFVTKPDDRKNIHVMKIDDARPEAAPADYCVCPGSDAQEKAARIARLLNDDERKAEGGNFPP